jgi:hypothetical protein
VVTGRLSSGISSAPFTSSLGPNGPGEILDRTVPLAPG